MTLLVLGHGYSAGHFLAQYGPAFGRVVATTRREAKARVARPGHRGACVRGEGCWSE